MNKVPLYFTPFPSLNPKVALLARTSGAKGECERASKRCCYCTLPSDTLHAIACTYVPPLPIDRVCVRETEMQRARSEREHVHFSLSASVALQCRCTSLIRNRHPVGLGLCLGPCGCPRRGIVFW